MPKAMKIRARSRTSVSKPSKGETSLSWEEQREVEKALRESLKTQSPPAKKPRIGESESSEMKMNESGKSPLSSPQRKKMRHSVRKSASHSQEEDKLKVELDKLENQVQNLNKVSSPGKISQPLRSRVYPSTEQFLRYMCYKDTDFLPEELLPFASLTVERFGKRKVMKPKKGKSHKTTFTGRSRSFKPKEKPSIKKQLSSASSKSSVSVSANPVHKKKKLKKKKRVLPSRAPSKTDTEPDKPRDFKRTTRNSNP